jgi:hypothetical protein
MVVRAGSCQKTHCTDQIMVYIHSDTDSKMPHHFDAACAWYGALEHGENVRLTPIDEVENGRWDGLLRTRLFVGSTQFMETVFSRVGIAVPTLHHMLPDYQLTDVSAVMQQLQNGASLFIKPLATKAFSGFVATAQSVDILSRLVADTPLLARKPFDSAIVSETRCYVHNGHIADARSYAGDFRVSPDWQPADKWVNDAIDAPVAYTMDLAVLQNGQTVVVEYNDMWAIGNYGIENGLYYQMLRDRYFEVMEQTK